MNEKYFKDIKLDIIRIFLINFSLQYFLGKIKIYFAVNDCKFETHIQKTDVDKYTMYRKKYFNTMIYFSFFITFFHISRRKYWFRANFRFLIFDGFTRFGMSWTRFDYFWKMGVCLSVCVSVCAWQKFCGKCSSRTNKQNFMKLYI